MCSSKPCIFLEDLLWKAKCRAMGVIYVWFSMSLDKMSYWLDVASPFPALLCCSTNEQSRARQSDQTLLGCVFQAPMTSTAFSFLPPAMSEERILPEEKILASFPTSNRLRPPISKEIWLLVKKSQHLLQAEWLWPVLVCFQDNCTWN